MTNYNELVDHLVSTMPSNSMRELTPNERKSFDELYKEYSSMSIEDQLNNLKQLAGEFVTKIDQVINHLDVILDEEDKVTK